MICKYISRAAFTLFLLSIPCIALGQGKVADDQVVSLVDQRVDEWWLKPEEKLFDEIGWADDIRTAKQLSVEHNRPLFLFTMDGRVNTGRC
jgi:hypothetical protein